MGMHSQEVYCLSSLSTQIMQTHDAEAVVALLVYGDWWCLFPLAPVPQYTIRFCSCQRNYLEQRSELSVSSSGY